MTVIAFIALGLAAGVLAATLGVGGGIVYVPALVAVFSFAQHEAQGTSLAIIVPTTLVAALVHARARRIDWRTAGLLGVGGVVGGVLGASSALALDDTLLRRLFAVFLVLMAIRMLRRTSAREHEGPDPG
jgi:uncharacterized membrane protein YfcA